MMNIEGGRILISGGSGSWGRELAKQLLEQNAKEIIIFSRGEISQVDMERTFNNPRLKFVIGDVRDEKAVDRVMDGVDYVFQLAALKHVPICENYPLEAIYTNIIGMENLIDAAIRHKVRKFIDVSTDKAVDPINTYGLTKALGERLTIQANQRTRDTEFICIRGGNVIGTNGSLVPYIIKQIQTDNIVKVTDVLMTRFFLTLPEAIRLLLFASEEGIGGETYVMNMPSFWIVDLVDILIEHYGNEHTQLVFIGAREGEKVNEILISKHERHRTRYVNDNYYVIYPQLKMDRTHFHIWDTEEFRGSLSFPATGLTSADNLKDKEYLKELLKKSGWV